LKAWANFCRAYGAQLSCQNSLLLSFAEHSDELWNCHHEPALAGEESAFRGMTEKQIPRAQKAGARNDNLKRVAELFA